MVSDLCDIQAIFFMGGGGAVSSEGKVEGCGL